MKIVGLQKLTLLDYPGKVACTVFLGGCNFRCPFCHNGELLESDVAPLMTVEELLKAVCIVSGNDASVALGEHLAGSEEAFVARMNERAAELGMADILTTQAHSSRGMR